MSGALFLLYHSVNSFNFGKRQIHRVKETCEFCNSIAELESYNTTSFFTFCLVPLIPLKSKRILSKCSYCAESRQLSLKEWKKRKADQLNPLLERLQLHPNDTSTLLKAIDAAIIFQDEALLDKLINDQGLSRTSHAELSARIGKAYEHFSRWEDAEIAYRDALKLSDSLDHRERLAICLMKQGRSSEAATYLRHVFESNDRHKAWLTYWLIEGLMEEGRFDAAAKFTAIRDEMYPSFAKVKDYQTQRKLLDKHSESEKPYRSKILSESRKVGTRKGSLWGVLWPRLLIPGFFFSLLMLYILVAIDKGAQRPIYLVNGLNRPYSITIDDQTFPLEPQTPHLVNIKEGVLKIDWEGNNQGPQEVVIKTPFWERPFIRRVYLINPDRAAIFEYDAFAYENLKLTRYQQTTQIKTGSLLHYFDKVDYPFAEVPLTIKGDPKYPSSKTRLSLRSIRDSQDRIELLKKSMPPEQLRKEIGEIVNRETNDTLALEWLVGQLPTHEAFHLLEKGLAARPIHTCWHRCYQELMARQRPQVDLRETYRKLVEETKRSPQSLYLLSRLESAPTREKLLREAAEGLAASPDACHDLGDMHLARGEFKTACEWNEKACRLADRRSPYLDKYLISLLAAKENEKVLKETRGEMASPSGYARFIYHRLAAQFALEGKAGAEKEAARFLQASFGSLPHPSIPSLNRQFKTEIYLLEENRAALKAEATTGIGNKSSFLAVVNLFPKELEQATQLFEPGDFTDRDDRLWEVEAIWRGVFYLAAVKANNKKLADQQMALLTKALAQGGAEARQAGDILTGKIPFDGTQVVRSFPSPDLKRVLLLVYAQKFPSAAPELRNLSEKLNFQRDLVSLCLKEVR